MLIRRDVGETYGGGNMRETGRHTVGPTSKKIFDLDHPAKYC